jgi:molybdate transport system substrate-binding protein
MSDTVRVLSGGAAQGLVESVRAAFPHRIEATFGAVGAMRGKLLAGDPADVMILSRALIEALVKDGHVVATTDLGSVETAVAARAGDAAPRLDSADALREALLAADEVHFPDPALATAGIHFDKVMRDLGVRDRLAARLRPAANGATAMRALAASTARQPIGCTQATEILATAGVALAAPLPPGSSLATVYTAGITARSAERGTAEALIGLMADPRRREERRRLGFV